MGIKEDQRQIVSIYVLPSELKRIDLAAANDKRSRSGFILKAAMEKVENNAN